MKSRIIVPKMSIEKGLETITILAKHLRTFAPILAAIGGSKGEVKKELTARLGAQLLADEVAKIDLLLALSNLIGEEVKEFDLNSILKKLRASWRENKMRDALIVCYEIGLLDRSDLVNFTWVEMNWRKHGRSSTGPGD